MKRAMRFCLARWATYLVFTGALGVCAAGFPDSVETAFRYMNSEASQFPKGASDAELKASDLLRAHPPETKRLLIKALSKGGERGKAEKISAAFLELRDQLEVARATVPTYSVGDKSMPFLGFLAYRGEPQDMKFVVPWVTRDPDSEGVIGLTQIMSENPNARSALKELKSSVPGKWQESLHMKRFFDTLGAGSPNSETNAVKQVGPNEAAAGDVSRQPSPAHTGSQTDSGKAAGDLLRWQIGGVFATVATLLVVLWRRRRSSATVRKDS